MINTNYTFSSINFEGRNGKEALRCLGKKPKLPYKKMKKAIEAPILEEIKPQFIQNPNLAVDASNLSSKNKAVVEKLNELVSSESATKLLDSTSKWNV